MQADLVQGHRHRWGGLVHAHKPPSFPAIAGISGLFQGLDDALKRVAIGDRQALGVQGREDLETVVA